MMSQNFSSPFSNLPSVARLLLAGLCVGELSAFTVDGVRNTTSETGYTSRAVQTIQNSGGQENVLANLHSAVTDANLRLFIGGTGAF